jgi:hypothetical protein
MYVIVVLAEAHRARAGLRESIRLHIRQRYCQYGLAVSHSLRIDEPFIFRHHFSEILSDITRADARGPLRDLRS